MSENLKLFLGADEGGADDGLAELALRCQREGYQLVRHYRSSEIIIKAQKRLDLVEIAGGWTDICVAKTAGFALEREDIKHVIVHIDKCRSGPVDTGESPDSQAKRIEDLYWGIDYDLRNDERIVVLPSKRVLKSYF